MGLLSSIHLATKERHQALHEQPFIKKYQDNTITLLEHYRHLSQLLPIYEALEKKLHDGGFEPRIPVGVNELLSRSLKIKNDLSCMLPYLNIVDKEIVSSATQRYVKKIEAMKVSDEKSIEIFAHFLVRVLGDMFGGQKIKESVLKLYKRSEVELTSLYPGISFYTFNPNTFKDFTHWLNELKLAEKEKFTLINCMNDGLSRHAPIFEELERANTSKTPSLYSFFNANKGIILGVSAVLAGGVLCTNHYKRG